MLFLFAVATLGMSGFAAWLFFGGPEDDPTRVRAKAHMAETEAMTPRAEAGEAAAQYELARLHDDPEFESRDRAAAFEWYSKAAQKGHAGAQFALGAMYAKGEAVNQDYFRAAEWYRLAADMGGNADAETALAELYFEGRGVPHDIAEARAWYRRAAARGHPLAQHRLGVMVMEGWAGTPDPVEAYKWFSLALPRRDLVMAADPALDPRAARDRVAKGMTRDQLKRAEAAVRAWRPKR